MIFVFSFSRGDRNHGLCLCKSCLSSREGVDREVSPVLPVSAESSNSCTQSRADIDGNCAQLQTPSTENFIEQCEGQSMDDGSWAGAVRSYLGFPLHGAVGGAFYTSLHDPLAHGNLAINENCSTAVLELGAGFGDDMFAWSSAEGMFVLKPCFVQ